MMGGITHHLNFVIELIVDFTIIFPYAFFFISGKSVAAIHIDFGWPDKNNLSSSSIKQAPAIFPYVSFGL